MTSSCCTSDLDCSQLLRGPQYLDNGASDENAAGALEAETPFDTAAKTPIVAGTAVCVNGAQLTPPTASTAGHDLNARDRLQATASPDSTAAAADDSDSPSPQQADDLQSLLARLQGRSEEESALVQARLLAAAEAAPAPSPRGRAASSRALAPGLVSSRSGGGCDGGGRSIGGGSGRRIDRLRLPRSTPADGARVPRVLFSSSMPTAVPLPPDNGEPLTEWRMSGLTDATKDPALLDASEVKENGEDAKGDAGDDEWSPAATAASATALAGLAPPSAPPLRRSSCSGNSGSSAGSGRRGSGGGGGSGGRGGRPASPPGRWTPRDAEATSSNAAGAHDCWPMYSDHGQQLQYPAANYGAAEAARRIRQQRPSAGAGFRVGNPRPSSSRPLLQAQRSGLIVMRRTSNLSASGRQGSAGSSGKRGGGRGRRWAGAALPGVQLYGRVHTWKERNKERYGLFQGF